MINLLRGEIYKLFRSKSVYVCSIVGVVFVLLLYGMFSLAAAMQEGEVENGSYGMVVENSEMEEAAVWDEINVPMMVQMMFSSVGILIVTIFTSVHIFGEYGNGAIKNVVGKGYGRGKIFVSRYLSAIVGSFFIETIMILSVLLCETVILDAERLSVSLMISMGKYVGVQFVLTAAFTGIMVMISQMCRNLGVGIAIGVGLVMFSSFVTMALNAVLSYFSINVDVKEYWVVELISNCPVLDMPGEFVIRTIICAVVWCVLAYVAGNIHFGKADVK